MRQLKVLIVDDEPDFIEIMSLRLLAEGCEVISAVNGKEAIEQVEKHFPDLVLLDILMPLLDGMAALEIIRKKHKKLPVFMLTAFSTEDRRKEAERIGADGFIVKDASLKEGIKEALKKTRKNFL